MATAFPHLDVAVLPIGGALCTDTVPSVARESVTIDAVGIKEGSDPGRDGTVSSDDRSLAGSRVEVTFDAHHGTA